MSKHEIDRFQLVREELQEALSRWYKDDLQEPGYRTFTESAIQQLLPGVDDIQRAHDGVQYIQQSVYALEGVRGVLHYVQKLRDLMRAHEKLKAAYKRKGEQNEAYEGQITSLKNQVRELASSCIPESKIREILSEKDDEVEGLKKKLIDLGEQLKQAEAREDEANRQIQLLNNSQYLLRHKNNTLMAKNEELTTDLKTAKGEVHSVEPEQLPMPKLV